MSKGLSGLQGGFMVLTEYQSVLQSVPVPTVDFVITKVIDGKKKFLLIKRNEGAYVNEWFVLGGRQKRGELMLDAVLRVAGREAGLDLNSLVDVKFSHCQDVYNPESENSEGQLPAWHSIWHFHVIEVLPSFTPKIDSTSSEWGWFGFDTLPPVPEVVSEGLSKAKHLLI